MKLFFVHRGFTSLEIPLLKENLAKVLAVYFERHTILRNPFSDFWKVAFFGAFCSTLLSRACIHFLLMGCNAIICQMRVLNV